MGLNWCYVCCTVVVTVINANIKVRLKLFQVAWLPFLGMKSSSCGLIKVLTYDLNCFCFAFRIPSIEFYVTPTAVSAESCSLNSTQKLLFDAYLNLISVNCSAYPVLQDVPHRQLLLCWTQVFPLCSVIFFTFCKWMHSLLLNILTNRQTA